MAAPPQPGAGRKDQTVTYTGLFRLHDWILLAPLALLGIALGVWGFIECAQCEVVGLLPMVIKSVALVRGNVPYGLDKDPWQLVVAQFLMPGLALFGGIRLVLLNLRRDVRVALARRQHNHTIVCGISDSGRQIVENLRAAGQNVVAITLNDQDPDAAACERLGIAVLKGDATQLGMLRLAGLQRADALVVTCGSDAVNLEVALRVAAASNARTRPLRILTELQGAWLLEFLRSHPTATLSTGMVDVRPFDLAANAARLLLQNPAFGRVWRMAPRAKKSPALQPHLLIVGLGEVGMQIIAQAMQTTFALPDMRLAVTILDQQGEASAGELDARYPGLKDSIDREFVPANFSADDPASWPAVWGAVDQVLDGRPATWTTVAVIVTLKADEDALHTALQLRERLDQKGCAGTPVFVRMREQHQLGQFIAGLDGPNRLLERLISFGDLGVLTSPDTLIDETQDGLAHAVHETYLAGHPSGPAAVPWSLLAERFKQSNRGFADHIPAKLAYAGLRLEPGSGPPIALTDAEIEAMSAAEHGRWVVERRAAGWTLGEADDAVARRHRYLLPWHQLDEAVREQNRDAIRAIPAAAAAAGMTIRRERAVETEAQLTAVPPDERAIAIVDPHLPASWDFANKAVEHDAKLWLLWHEGTNKPLTAASAPSTKLRAAVELAISAREAATLRHVHPPRGRSMARPDDDKTDAEAEPRLIAP